MGKKLDLPTERALISFYQGDIATLKEFYSSHGYNMAVRELIHKHCKKLRERANREANTNVQLDLDLDISELAGAGGSPADE
jgi:hypothetical protein